MKPETRFRNNKVIPFLKKLKRTKIFSIQQRSIAGDPDLIICMFGLFIAMELKDDGEKPRPLQEQKLGEVRHAGGLTVVAFPSNWERVKIWLLDLNRGVNNGTYNYHEDL